MKHDESRRAFLQAMAASTCVAGLSLQAHTAQETTIQGFDDTKTTLQKDALWRPFSERKVRVGIAGFGFCKFGAYFGFQDHPNVKVAVVTDLIPERCQGMARECRCEKTYPSLEEMVKDDALEAIFVATDTASHAQHCIDVLEHGKHVGTSVPAEFGSLEDADRVFEAVKRTGLKNMMFETSAYHNEVYAMRTLYDVGEFGKMNYSEGEYYPYMKNPISSYKDWRVGLPQIMNAGAG
jgi:predicted dehydrogenase